MGYIDIKQQETYEKHKNRGWYSKWYWYFIYATTTDSNNDDNTPALTVTATATINNSNNYNNYNVIIIKIIIITIKMKSGFALKKIKSSYILSFASFLIRWKKCSLTLCF